MEVDGAMVHEYYRRAFEDANPHLRRQDTATSSESVASTSSVIASSSLASVSSQSVISTSTASSTSAASTTSTTPSSTTSISSITSGSTTLSSAIQTTDSVGNIFTTTLIIVPSVTPTPASSNNKSTNTGAIVGGVVGGVALIALIIIGGLLIRRKMRKDEFEANIFDPDRNVERPTSIPGSHPGNNFDLAGAGLGAAAGAGAAAAASDRASHVTPYSYAPTSTGPTSTHHGSSVAGAPEMSQAHSPVSSGYYQDYNYGNNANYPNQYPNYNQYQTMPSIGVGDAFPNPYGPGYQPAAGHGGQAAAAGFGAAAGAGAAGLARNQTASSGYPLSSDGRSTPNASPPPGAAATLAPVAPLNPRAAKEREAFGGRFNYNVANPNDPVATARNPSPTPSRTSGQNPTSPVTVHQDGGRVPDEEDDQGEAEIPPTYDSIPRDTR